MLGVLLILAGFFVFLSPYIIVNQSTVQKTYSVGIVALMLGLIIITSYSGTQIDVSRKKYRDYFSIATFKIGNWESLPQVIKVKVTKVNFRTTNTPNGISPTLSYKVTEYKTLLIDDNQKSAFTFTYAKKDLAIKAGEQLSTAMGIMLELKI